MSRTLRPLFAAEESGALPVDPDRDRGTAPSEATCPVAFGIPGPEVWTECHPPPSCASGQAGGSTPASQQPGHKAPHVPFGTHLRVPGFRRVTTSTMMTPPHPGFGRPGSPNCQIAAI